MCILFIAVNQYEGYPLVIAANRDEYYRRETRMSEFWEDRPNLLAGKDLKAGGTWMGVTRSGRIAALTNFRDPINFISEAPSRGQLVTDYLDGVSVEDWARYLRATRSSYNGYNLLFGDWNALYVYSSRRDELSRLSDGFYGLSNAQLGTPWPKVQRGLLFMKQHCREPNSMKPDVLFQMLRDETKANDDGLPDTGLSIERERLLSSTFIRGDDYGTRSSTILTVDHAARVQWTEQSFELGETAKRQKFDFTIQLCRSPSQTAPRKTRT